VSKLNDSILRPELVQYAALDAYAGALIGEIEYNAMKDVYQKGTPKIESVLPNQVVRLLPENSIKVAALGRVQSVKAKSDFLPASDGTKRREKTWHEIEVRLDHNFDVCKKSCNCKRAPAPKRLIGSILAWRYCGVECNACAPRY
jgi:hypothetical protein